MTNQKWITKGSGDKKKHVLINTDKETREIQVKDLGVSPSTLEKEAWNMMGSLANVTTVDQLLLQMKKYSGTLDLTIVGLGNSRDISSEFIAE